MSSVVDASSSPPRVTVPRDYNAADDFVDRHLREGRGEKVAFVDSRGGTLTYAELAARVAKAGNALRALGVVPGAACRAVHARLHRLPLRLLGRDLLGAVPVPLNTLLTTRDYALMLQDSRARSSPS